MGITLKPTNYFTMHVAKIDIFSMTLRYPVYCKSHKCFNMICNFSKEVDYLFQVESCQN